MVEMNMDAMRTSLTKLWPPTESTRVKIVEKLMRRLFVESSFFLLEPLSEEEAREKATRIEAASFASTVERFKDESQGDGIAALHAYSRQTGYLTMEALKRGGSPKQSNENSASVNRDLTAFSMSEFIEGCDALEVCRCSSMGAGELGGIALAKALEKHHNLKKLDISNDMIGRKGAVALSKALWSLSCITELSLSNLNLQDQGVVTIFSVLKYSASSLEILDLAGNMITVNAAPPLADCIAAKPLLRILNLSKNKLMDEGANMIGRALENGHENLEEVYFSCNNMSGIGAVCLVRAVVSGKPKFRMLQLSSTSIPTKEIELLWKAVKGINTAEGSMKLLISNKGQEAADCSEEIQWSFMLS